MVKGFHISLTILSSFLEAQSKVLDLQCNIARIYCRIHLLERIDKALVTRKQKLLNKAGLCPRLNWVLSILEMPISWVNNILEANASRYLRKWSGIARYADLSRLCLPKCSGSLELPSISLFYKKTAELPSSAAPRLQIPCHTTRGHH